jgi:hypothetical protein
VPTKRPKTGTGARAKTPRRSRVQRSKKGAESAFVEALVESGQAARPDAGGKLPKGATHELVENKKGEVTVVRRRFSIS